MKYHLPIIRTIPAILSYGLITILFVNALISPEGNINFIYNAGIFIFVTEFLSIHSSGMLSNDRWKVGQKLVLISFYLIFVVAFSYATHSKYPALMFTLSLIAKAFSKSKPIDRIIWPAIIFVSTVFLSIVSAPLASKLFVFPQDVLSKKDSGTSGLFVDKPQALLVWGILYYSLSIALEAWFNIKESRSELAK